MADDPEQKKPLSGKKPGRVVFIDQARAFALTMMLVGHTLHHFLGEPWRSGEAYNEYQFFRGITSALFLMVSGFSFVVASFKYWDDYTHISPRLIARLRRIGYILFLAYLLHMYGGTLARMVSWYNPNRLEAFLRFDVLQNIGFGLLILHTAAFAVKKIEHFWKITLALFIGVLLLATLTYDPAIDAHLPLGLAPALNMYHRSLFPLIPFTGFMLVGAFFAYFFWQGKQKGTEWKAMAALAATGVGFLLFEYVIRNHVSGGVFPFAVEMEKTPGNTFARCGSAMLVISGLFFLEKLVVILPELALTMSKDSLAIYVVHLPIIYGGTLGVAQQYKQGMSPLQVFAYIAVLFTLMILLAWSIDWVRKRYPVIQTKIRRTVILAWCIQFVLWPRYTVLSVTVSLGVAVFFMLGGYKRTAERLKTMVEDIKKKKTPSRVNIETE
ncbi:MAG: DUF1624 domain-containing protein [Deltaproteobacteria bacterium]|nr:DUF1624 domain-containing protein [Deltaproteobacteria bacterium]MBN2673458.1 DUF1624 domain-containing protein [Deltaproteobacteria bacterium]